MPLDRKASYTVPVNGAGSFDAAIPRRVEIQPMPLLDHFHEPLDPRADWQSFHNCWATAIAADLDRTLPARYFARVHVDPGQAIEVDVAESTLSHEIEVNGNTFQVAVDPYEPPPARVTLPAVFPDDLEIQVCDAERGARVVAVIELVSPTNKNGLSSLRALAAKSATYVHRGVGMLAVNVVTTRHFKLTAMDLRIVGGDTLPDADKLYAVSYRPVHRAGRNYLDIWRKTLAIGESLPTLPLALRGYGCIPLDLEASYMEARRRIRLD